MPLIDLHPAVSSPCLRDYVTSTNDQTVRPSNSHHLPPCPPTEEVGSYVYDVFV